VVKRQARWAGQFYEADPKTLRERIEWAFTHRLGPGEIPKPSPERVRQSIGFVAPHAGYVYSGPVAAHTYARIAKEGKPDTFILIGPNHTGLGAAVAVWTEGAWETPLGEAPVDEELAAEIVKNSRFAKPDTTAHKEEHSLEVQIPFLQYLFSEVTIVPITVMYQAPETSKDLAKAITEAVRKLGRDVTIIASSDMSHYEPHEIAVRKDREALEKITSIDPEGLYKIVIEKDISMCGYGPVMTLLYYAKENGGEGAEVLKYATSGDVTGERAWVVGYAAVRVH